MASEIRRVQSNTTSLNFLYTNYSRGFAHVVLSNHIKFRIKSALAGLRQFLPSESPLKLMKYTFYFTFKVLFVFKIFNFLSCIFIYEEKQSD